MRSQRVRRLAALFGLLLLAVLVANLNGRTVILQISQVNWTYLALTVATIGLSVTLGALNLYWLFAPRLKFSFIGFLPVYWIGWAVGLVVPGQIGDVASISILLKRRGIRAEMSVGLLLLDKVISITVMLLFAFYGIWSISAELSLGENRLIFIFGIIIAIFGFMVVVQVFAPQSRLMIWIRGVLTTVKRITVEYPRRVLRNALVTVVKILLMGLAYFFMFFGLGVRDVGVGEVVCLAMASGLVAYIPVSFNGIGTVELAGVSLFSQIGISPPLILAAYLLLRVTTLLTAWVPALFWIARVKQSGTISTGSIRESFNGQKGKPEV